MTIVELPDRRAATRARVCVMVPTFRRASTLSALLQALGSQTVAPAGIEVLVVDNDGAGSARDVVARHAAALPFPLHYACVAAPGLSVVRNYGLSFARRRFDLLAMIDDDEIPAPQWLEELLRTQARTGATAVIGPVPQRLPQGAPQWIRRGRFFELPTFVDGALVRDGYSGNCVIDMHAAAVRGLVFDPHLNLAGGEDQLFFRELIARGGDIAFAAGAIATELVAPERVNAAYIVRRSFRCGNTLWFCDARIHAGHPLMLARRMLLGAGRIARGVLLLVPRWLFAGTAGVVAAACDVARGAGTLAGLLGITYQQYRNPHGSGDPA